MNYVRNDCKVFRFCGSKCHKNFKLRRTPRKTKWTKTFRKAAGKEMDMDTTLEFERKRNVPVKYNRELMSKTLRVMDQVRRIKERRERAFYEKRMKAKVVSETQNELHDLRKHLHRIDDAAVAETARETLREADERKEREKTQRRLRSKRKKETETAEGVDID